MIYGEVGGGGMPGTISLSGALNAVISQHIISVGVADNYLLPDDLPSDYDGGNTIFASRPRERYLALRLQYGRMIPSQSPLIRLALRGGLSVAQAEDIIDYTYNNDRGWLYYGANYDPVIENKFAVGLVASPQLEFTLTKGWGMAMGVFADINTFKPIGGVQMSMIIGRLRWKKAVN